MLAYAETVGTGQRVGGEDRRGEATVNNKHVRDNRVHARMGKHCVSLPRWRSSNQRYRRANERRRLTSY